MQIKTKHAVIAALLLGVGYYVWKKRKGATATQGSEERTGGGGGFSGATDGKTYVPVSVLPQPNPIVVINSTPNPRPPRYTTAITYNPTASSPSKNPTPTSLSGVVPPSQPIVTANAQSVRGADGSYLNSEGFYN